MVKHWWMDVLCVAALLAAGVLHWPTGDVSLSVAGPEAPFWGTIRDALLDGPDAGEWARSMLALNDGRYESLEAHRLPSWQLVARPANPLVRSSTRRRSATFSVLARARRSSRRTA